MISFGEKAKIKKAGNLNEGRSHVISSIIQGCPDTLTMRFKAKPYILWKDFFHRICPKFYKVKHGHDFF